MPTAHSEAGRSSHGASSPPLYPAAANSHSQRPVAATNSQRVSASASAGHASTASPHTVLTSQSLQQHDLRQHPPHCDIDVEYSQVERASRSEVSVDWLGICLDRPFTIQVYQEPIGMLPMERFRASSIWPQYINTGNTVHALAPYQNGMAVPQTLTQGCNHGVSSIVASPDIEIVNGHLSAPKNIATCTDAVVFAPEHQYDVPASAGSAYAHSIADWINDLNGVGVQFESFPSRDRTTPTYSDIVAAWGNDFAGIAAQFDSCPYWNHATSPHISDDVHLKE